MENREKICRFCFEKCNTNFEAIEGSTHEILKMLLVTTNLAISDEPVMCTSCSEILQKYLVFKKTCLDIRGHAVAFGNDQNNCEAGCEFCMNLLKNCSFTILDIEKNISEKTMLDKYFPELDISASKKLVICEICHGALVNFFSFVTISSIVEDKIKEYCEAEGVNKTDLIKLKNVLQITSKNVCKENDNEFDVFKMEDTISIKSENKEIINQGGICTLCLEKCDNFKAIDENTENILDILLPKIDFTIIQGPVVCKNCEEMLIKCFDFKTTCLHTHNCIVQFVNKEDNVKLDLKVVYMSKNVASTGVPEDHDVCRFCMSLVKNCSAVHIDVEKGDVILEKIIEQCLPELDLNIIKTPVICASCHVSLLDCFYFVMNCSIVEEKIKKYCKSSNINVNGKIELSSSFQLMIGDVTTRREDDNRADIIKVEEEFCEEEKEIGDRGDTVKLEQIFANDRENDINYIENKNKNLMEINVREVNNEKPFTSKNLLVCEEVSNELGAIKIEEIFCEENETKNNEENVFKMEEKKCLLEEEIDIKTDDRDFNSCENNIVLPQSEGNRSLYRRKKCSVLNLERDVLGCSKKHLLEDKNSSEVTVCKCDSCSFETKHKSYLKNHLQTHKDPSEITVYRCKCCSYQSKHKSYLKSHLLVHKNPSEVPMYKCDYCSYQTKYKNIVKGHLLTHKFPSEVEMYKCDFCLFQTKHKSSLKSHMMLHKNPSEVTMHKCDYCSFQTKYKNRVKAHLVTHKDPSEVTMYKCDSCSFQTKYKSSLKNHMVSHINPSEVTMYKCDSCSFQTIHKRSFRNHNLLTHKFPSEVAMYKCDFCLFQTKHKSSLKSHLMLHKSPSEVTMYKCDYCSFQTKRKCTLKDHLITHKNPPEVTMYKCNCCLFRTKRKTGLKRHMISHKKSS